MHFKPKIDIYLYYNPVKINILIEKFARGYRTAASITVSKTVYQGSSPCNPILISSTKKQDAPD